MNKSTHSQSYSGRYFTTFGTRLKVINSIHSSSAFSLMIIFLQMTIFETGVTYDTLSLTTKMQFSWNYKIFALYVFFFFLSLFLNLVAESYICNSEHEYILIGMVTFWFLFP